MFGDKMIPKALIITEIYIYMDGKYGYCKWNPQHVFDSAQELYSVLVNDKKLLSPACDFNTFQQFMVMGFQNAQMKSQFHNFNFQQG
jgi:hypothetical protein